MYVYKYAPLSTYTCVYIYMCKYTLYAASNLIQKDNVKKFKNTVSKEMLWNFHISKYTVSVLKHNLQWNICNVNLEWKLLRNEKKKRTALGILFLDFIKLNTEHDELANFYLKDTVIVFIFSGLKIYVISLKQRGSLLAVTRNNLRTLKKKL